MCWCELGKVEIGASLVIVASLPSFRQELSKLVEIRQSSDKNNFLGHGVQQLHHSPVWDNVDIFIVCVCVCWRCKHSVVTKDASLCLVFFFYFPTNNCGHSSLETLTYVQDGLCLWSITFSSNLTYFTGSIYLGHQGILQRPTIRYSSNRPVYKSVSARLWCCDSDITANMSG